MRLSRSVPPLPFIESIVAIAFTQAFERIETEEPQLATSFHKFIVNLLAERLKHSKEELQNLLE